MRVILEFFVHDSSSPFANSPSYLLLTTSPHSLCRNCCFRVGLCCRVSLGSCSKTGFLCRAHKREIPYRVAAAKTAEDSRFSLDLAWTGRRLPWRLIQKTVTSATLPCRFIEGPCFLAHLTPPFSTGSCLDHCSI